MAKLACDFFYFFVFLFGYYVVSHCGHQLKFSLTHIEAQRAVYITAIIALVCFFVFIGEYGGISYVLENISRIRSGTDENKSYLGAFVRLFSVYIEFAFFLALAICLSSTRWKFVAIFLFIAAFIKVFLDGGRGGLINLFLGAYICLANHKKRLYIPFVFALLVFTVLFGIYGKIFVFQAVAGLDMAIPETDTVLHEIFKEFSHQFFSLQLAIDQGAGLRYFGDFFYFMVKPLKLFGVDVPDSISYFNTFLIKGQWDSEIPPGLIALGVYEGGVVFGAMVPFTYGLLIAMVDKRVFPTSRNCPIALAFHAIACLYLPFLLTNGDPALFVQWVFAYLILFLGFIFWRKTSLVLG